MILALDLMAAEGLQGRDGDGGHVGPLPADRRHGLHRGSEKLRLIPAHKVAEDEPRRPYCRPVLLLALLLLVVVLIHPDGHDDQPPAERHVLGHAVLETHRLERQREAGRYERVALLLECGGGGGGPTTTTTAAVARGRTRRRAGVRERLLNCPDRLEPMRQRGRDEAGVLAHQV